MKCMKEQLLGSWFVLAKFYNFYNVFLNTILSKLWTLQNPISKPRHVGNLNKIRDFNFIILELFSLQADYDENFV